MLARLCLIAQRLLHRANLAEDHWIVREDADEASPKTSSQNPTMAFQEVLAFSLAALQFEVAIVNPKPP